MKIGFPRIGDMYIAYKAIFEEIGIETITPNEPTKETIEFGIKYSPEYTCFPFKTLLGTYKELAESGANLIVSYNNEDLWSCQASDFDIAHKAILKKQGHDIEFLNISPQNLKEACKTLNINIMIAPKLMAIFLSKLLLTEYTRERYHELMAYAKDFKDAKKYLEASLKKIDQTKGFNSLLKLKKEISDDADKIFKKKIDPIKICLVGDFYTIAESSINNYLIERLGRLGVHVVMTYKFSDSVKRSIGLASFGSKSSKTIFKNACPYISKVGGLANHTISHAVTHASTSDGMIHIYPFTCMPEMVAKTILPKLGKDLNIPILHLPIDEQSGVAGIQTRIEAFVDLLKIKHKK